MQRVSTPTAVAQKPAYATGGEPGFFTQGDPVQGLPATVPGQDFLNRIQEEICNVILASGRQLDGADDTQLLRAVLLLIAANAPTPIAANTEAAGIVERATTEEVAAGVDTERYVCPADLLAALMAGLAGVARLAAVGAYTRQQHPVAVALADLAGIDCDLHALATHTLAADSVLPTAIHQGAGKFGELIITGAGSFTLGATTNWLMADGSVVVFAPVAGKRTRILWESDSVNMVIYNIKQEA